jgi:tetratricopeptide (TPR) repeat protein
MPRPAPARDMRTTLLLCGAGIAAAALAVYARGLGGLFLYDDVDSIVGNASIRHFSAALLPPAGLTVSGRPVLNLSFAINYAVSGAGAWSYHALNIAIHGAAALALFGIVRRTLATPLAGSRSEGECLGIASAVALLWAVHPLQTESVAYVVQRGESLMGLFYLTSLYAFVRLTAAGSLAGVWAAVSVAACLLGMGTKEAMATAPLVIFLYDRTFAAGSFREAWRRRKAIHLALAACWVPLAFLVAGTGGRGGTAGFGSAIPWWVYLLAQLKAVALYLRLALWPHPLVGDYGRIIQRDLPGVAVGAAVVLCLAAGTFLLLRRKPPIGFLGAWFLLVLAPSSSVIPVSTEIMAEHRMYLPLAAVVTLGVLALRGVLGLGRLFLAALALLALAFGVLTVRRVGVYESAFTFWTDVAIKNPGNAGAWNNLGNIMAESGDRQGAIAHYRRALSLAPAYADAHHNLGKVLAASGRVGEAIENYEDALRFQPGNPSIHVSLGSALAREGKADAAAGEYRAALKLDPDRADAWFNLGGAMVEAGNPLEAADAYAHAVRLRPDFADARVNYGNVLAQLDRVPEAVQEFHEALRLEPGAADVHNNLGSLLAETGKLAEAKAQFEEAIRLKPDYQDARDNLERLRALERLKGGP